MKRNPLTLAVGVVLVVIFGLMLFVFQVRQTELAVVTTFGKPSGEITQPGPYFKWPWPVQKVHKFDRRTRQLEGKFEETQTADGKSLLVQVYVGWAIAAPQVFFPGFSGSVTEAEKALDDLVRSTQNAVVGRHPLSDFISPDEKALKFAEIENEMLQAVQGAARDKYGMDVKFVGLNRLGLPESITEKVFERMKAERQKYAQTIQSDGERQAIQIRSTAETERARILAEAEAEATRIRGQGDAEAAKSLAVFQQNPELAVFLLKLTSLEFTLKDRSTLILDPRTPPFDLLRGVAAPTLPKTVPIGPGPADPTTNAPLKSPAAPR